MTLDLRYTRIIFLGGEGGGEYLFHQFVALHVKNSGTKRALFMGHHDSIPSLLTTNQKSFFVIIFGRTGRDRRHSCVCGGGGGGMGVSVCRSRGWGWGSGIKGTTLTQTLFRRVQKFYMYSRAVSG